MTPLVTRLPGDPEPGSPEWLILEVRYCRQLERLARLERLAERLPAEIERTRFDVRDCAARLGLLPGQATHHHPARNGRNLANGESRRIVLEALASGSLTLQELEVVTGLGEGQIHHSLLGLRAGPDPIVLKDPGRGTPYRLNPDRKDPS